MHVLLTLLLTIPFILTSSKNILTPKSAYNVLKSLNLVIILNLKEQVILMVNKISFVNLLVEVINYRVFRSFRPIRPVFFPMQLLTLSNSVFRV